ncbi:MAG TPA: NAD(P)H-hydrate dehydratase, partial [Nevskiaceae bacterium]|nr:NAD(P)H-hydrate dehydratase [Nevskiaceae bacterium]
VLIVGGDYGMAGAVLMAARAALRAGAGMVTVATRAEHARTLVAAQPEVMFRPVDKQEDLVPLLERADVVAIGPGLGQAAWGRKLWEAAAERPHLVVDADALNLLAQVPRRQGEWILTPHPGEAARLLGCSTHDIQADRLAAVRRLAERYGGYPVLKGAGTLVWQGTEVALCPFGNPGMGTGGMGDALTGIVAACLAQGLTPADAAVAGVLVHALAGDAAARTGGERGLLPTDLIDQLRQVVNPDG